MRPLLRGVLPWQCAYRPLSPVLTRQDLPMLDCAQFIAADGLQHCGYILANLQNGNLDLNLIALRFRGPADYGREVEGAGEERPYAHSTIAKKPLAQYYGRCKPATLALFRDFGGMFMEHCHNTMHEDNAMPLRWEINDSGAPFLRPLPTPIPHAAGRDSPRPDRNRTDKPWGTGLRS